MRISVVIPAYNAVDFVGDAIESVLSQTYQDIELICVDNNSSDKTLELLKLYQERFPEKITVVQELKKGAPAARNKGLSLASGEYVQFLDSDDVLYPDKIKQQVELIESQDLPTFIVGSARYIDLLSGEEKKVMLANKASDNAWLMLFTGAGNTCANLFQRSALLAIGGWNEALKSGQEYDLMFRLMQYKPVVALDMAVNTLIRLRADGITGSDGSGNYERYVDYLARVIHYIEEQQLLEAEPYERAYEILFHGIRNLFAVNPQKSKLYYQQFIRGKYTPVVSANNSKIYIMAYKLLGFNMCEWIYKKTGR